MNCDLELANIDIWVTVKLGDTLAFLVNHAVVAEVTALQPLFFACYSLAHYSKLACTFDNNGCANYFFMEGKMLKKSADFDMSGPETNLLIH